MYNSLNSIYRSIGAQSIQVYYEIAIKKYLQSFYSILFQNNNSLNVFSDVTYSQHEKFKELIDERYRLFVVLYPKYKEVCMSFIFNLSKLVFEDFEVLAHRLKAGSIHEKEIPIQLSKLLNFLLVICNTILGETGYSYGKPRTPPKVEGMAGEDMEGMVIGSVFKCISFLELFNQFLDVGAADCRNLRA